MTERERRKRLERLSVIDGRLKRWETRYIEIMDEIETIWGKVAGVSARSPDGMPHNPGFRDAYPEMLDRLEELKKQRQEWKRQATRIYREARRAESFIRTAIKGNKSEELLTLYYINKMSYRKIARVKNMKESTVRRKIKQGVLDIPEERFERSKDNGEN